MTDSISDVSTNENESSLNELPIAASDSGKAPHPSKPPSPTDQPLADQSTGESGHSEASNADSLDSCNSNPEKETEPRQSPTATPNATEPSDAKALESGFGLADALGRPKNTDSGSFDVPGDGSQPTVEHVIKQTSDLTQDDLTIISRPQTFADQKENVSAIEGRSVDHFEIKEYLGGGGMGLVFRGYDTVLCRSVAIKILPRNGATSELIQRFQIEAKSAARLDHPNISRVFQVGTDEACDYIIFEYVEGDNLAQLVRRIGPLPLELGLRYSFQLALALQHAYQRGVVHRDVKPANVVVTDGGKLKLIDLGLARSPKQNERDDSLTATGVTLGTYDYISPEQARDSRSADVRSDLYSLGCTMFFMFTGQPPYPQGTPIEKIIQHSSEKRPNPSDYRSDLPTGFNAITNKLLAIEPDDRFQRPAELIAEIQDFASKNNIPLLGYDENVIVKKIIQKPTWTQQLVPVLIPLVLLIGFVLYLDSVDRNDSTVNTSGVYEPRNSVNKSSEKSPPTSTNESELSGGKSEMQSPKETPSTKKTSSKTEIPKNMDSKKSAGNGANQKSTSDSKKAASTNAANVTYDFIAVGDSESVPKNGLSVKTLDQAFKTINDTRINEIRIFTDKVVLSRQLSLNVNGSVLVTAATDSPVIIFVKPEAIEKSANLKFRGGKLSFKGLHFRLDMSDVVDQVSGANVGSFSLFDFESISSATFTDCSMTIVNTDDEDELIYPDTSFIHITKSSKPVTDVSSADAINNKPALTIKDCCIRGDANFVMMPTSMPLTFAFNNGLIVTNQHGFVFGEPDAVEQPSSEIELYLTNVTSVTNLGFIQSTASLKGSFLSIRLEANQSIFMYPEASSALVQHIQMPDDFEKSQVLMIKGVDSFFPVNGTLWEIDTISNLATGIRTPGDLLDFNSMGDWLNLTGTAGNVADVAFLGSEIFSASGHEHTVFDYQLVGEFADNPAIRKKAGIIVDNFSPIPPAILD